MKHFILIFGILFIVSCNNNNSSDSKSETDTIGINIKVDTILMKPIEFNDICFIIDSSLYPKFTGLKDENFQNKINNILLENINSFVDSSKANWGGCPEEKKNDDNWLMWTPEEVNSHFDIFESNHKITSIIQYFVLLPGGDGNAWQISSKVINIDLNKNEIITKDKLILSLKNIDKINSYITSFFDRKFPEDKINYPKIENIKALDKLNLGIRNDSIILVLEAWPTCHASYTTYIIPIEKFTLN